VRRLLKSWATPPASRPSASSVRAWRARSSARREAAGGAGAGAATAAGRRRLEARPPRGLRRLRGGRAGGAGRRFLGRLTRLPASPPCELPCPGAF
jgi:hypothetical protein